MRLVQYRANGGARLGVVLGNGVVDVSSAATKAGTGIEPFHSVLTLLEAGAEALGFVRTLGANGEVVRVEQAQLDFPVAARKIVAIGLNYLDHAKEAGQPIPNAPLCFAKFTSSLSGPFDPIRLPVEHAQVDFEGELGVVIGRKAHAVSHEDAMGYVAGIKTETLR